MDEFLFQVFSHYLLFAFFHHSKNRKTLLIWLGKFYEITFKLKDNSLSNKNSNEFIKNEKEKESIHKPNEISPNENGITQIVD
jgi:hypothetical protein